MDFNKIYDLFTIGHLVFVLIALGLILFLFLITSKFNSKQIKIFTKIIAIIIIILEIIKIKNRIDINSSLNQIVPLTYCSLLLYLFIFIFFKNEKIQNLGYLLIMYYGLVPSLTYFLFPYGVIDSNPINSFYLLHSLFYHSIMLYLSLLFIFKKVHKYKLLDIIPYLFITLSYCLFVYLFNNKYDTNLMFINYAVSYNPLLLQLEEKVGLYYPFVVAIGETLGSFIISFCLTFLVQKRQKIK